MLRAIIIFCTTPSPEVSEKIAAGLIDRQLAACCNILPEVRSVYRWQGQVESAGEQLLLIKSTEENFKAIEDFILNVHPYDVPEIISVPVTEGNRDYLMWINESVKAK